MFVGSALLYYLLAPVAHPLCVILDLFVIGFHEFATYDVGNVIIQGGVNISEKRFRLAKFELSALCTSLWHLLSMVSSLATLLQKHHA